MLCIFNAKYQILSKSEISYTISCFCFLPTTLFTPAPGPNRPESAQRYNPITRHWSLMNLKCSSVLFRRDGVLHRPSSVVLHHGQQRVLIRGRRAVSLSRDAPVLAPQSRGQGQLEALLQGGPSQTEVC